MSPFLANVMKVAFMRSPGAVSSGKGNVSEMDVPFGPRALLEEPIVVDDDVSEFLGFLHFDAWSVRASVALCNCDDGIEADEMK